MDAGSLILIEMLTYFKEIIPVLIIDKISIIFIVLSSIVMWSVFLQLNVTNRYHV